MASISAPTFSSPSTRSDSNTHKFALTSSIFSSGVRRPSSVFHPHSVCSSTSHFLSSSRVSDTATLCRCYGNNNGEDNSESGSPSEDSWRWDSAIRYIFRNALKRLDDYMSSPIGGSKAACLGVVEKKSEVVIDANHSDEEWDWDRWRKHFDEIDGQERILSILKSQLAFAVKREDYDDAARLKVAIAAATTNDAVVRVMAQLNKAIKEERYHDAAFMRDIGGAGLVGWWAGISDDDNDPYGRIIRISAEHGRYVARSYSPRELTTATAGAPLFEIFLTMNRKGGYKLKAVYLKRMATSQDSQTSLKSLDNTGSLNALDPDHNKSDMFVKSSEDTEDDDNRDDDSDTVEGPFGFENILRDMIPGVKVVKVLKVTTPGKADRDLISKVIDQMMAEEDEENDAESESVDMEDGTKAESDEESNEIDLDAGSQDIDAGEQSQVAVKLVIGGLTQQISSKALHRELFRVPARLEKKGHKSFSFSIEKVTNRQVSSNDGKSPPNKKAKVQGRSSLDHVLFDLARFIGRGKIPMKVLKDLTELINLTLRQAQTHQPLSESTTFNRIEISASPDPLNGLYIGSHGLYTSEVIHLRRKFGQWQDDDSTKKPPNLEFYEYVEAVKLTGDPYVPAGQVAFRVKVGKRYLLPHEGIIPDEFGVIARYKGQGRLAEPGFQNPRWVDGELVILDGKFIKGGPVIGFLYWAPEYHFLVFFSRLRLQE